MENNNISGYSNPELDMINKDIAELTRERHSMEQDIAQKEADIKIKNGEIKSLQSELDTLAATLKQLENQKGEAQKRLNDLKAQTADVDRDLSEVESKICKEQKKVDKLRQQAEEQESVLHAQEEELNSKRQELEGLRQEEQQLEQQQHKSRDQLNELTKNLQDTQLQISQAKAKITHLQEQQRQMSDAIALYDSALATADASLVPDTSLQFNPEIEDIEYDEKEVTSVNEENKAIVDTFTNANGPGVFDGFDSQDAFSSKKAQEVFSTSTPDPFGNTFPSQSATGDFANDPFTAFENTNTVKQDPFDPFGDSKRNDQKIGTAAPTVTKDPFGDDPFANLHAPPRPESPSPALPPKKAKQPPPRPAPPRPSQGPTGSLRAAPVPAPPTPSPTPDPFANANSDPFAVQPIGDNNNISNFTGSSTGFADFANFDSKVEAAQFSVYPPSCLVGHIINKFIYLQYVFLHFIVFKNLLIPIIAEPWTSRLMITSAPPRPVSRPHAAVTLISKLPDFTEDPFRNYRYEDPFNITDPFSDEAEDCNANKNTTISMVDPFGFGSTSVSNAKNSLVKGFDADFGKAFSDRNKNIKSSETDTFSNDKTKTIDIDEAFSNKCDKSGRWQAQEIAHNLSVKLNLNDKKTKNDVDNIWNGTAPLALTEDEQLAWAAKQSLKTEEERRRLKEQEEAELALVLELSKRDKSGK
ncbi:hypothetical protein HZH68_012966 [Vespula germanica]|uniref:Epidermal growth factor receptor substrate 15-like 1 n=1 Tax=Vespula germanica TaxID=30212 RepID=A0A834MXG6_VESGE|nr:hypothetical protein HZH68_012966 [Vespula germanica]